MRARLCDQHSDRMYRSFCDSITSASKSSKWGKVNRLQKEQIKMCMDELSGRAISHSAKVARLHEQLDDTVS